MFGYLKTTAPLGAALLLSAGVSQATTTYVTFGASRTAQTFVTPYELDYTFVIAGGGGGDDTASGAVLGMGGGGAITGATIHEAAGTQLTLLVGARGEDGYYGGGGGGGAPGYDGLAASMTTAGTSTGNAYGGSGGSGGDAGNSTYVVGAGEAGAGGGGAGLYGQGGTSAYFFGGTGGSGSTGGAPGGGAYGVGRGGSGGIAGGGGGGGAGGGGGGYSGGAGGDAYSYYQFPVFSSSGYGGGGGGTLNNYPSSIGIFPYNDTDGYVQISYDYTPPAPPPPPPSAVPEPSTWALMLVGFGLVGGLIRSRRGCGHFGEMMSIALRLAADLPRPPIRQRARKPRSTVGVGMKFGSQVTAAANVSTT